MQESPVSDSFYQYKVSCCVVSNTGCVEVLLEKVVTGTGFDTLCVISIAFIRSFMFLIASESVVERP
jgi:hypothetical protein